MNFNKELLEVDVNVDSWQESARKAGELLLREHLIKREYIDSMIESVEEFGPYMILAPKVCFFHGKPGDLVHEPCLSLITLENEIRFIEFDNQPIKCAFAFGATDSSSHLELIQNISSILKDEEFLNLVVNNGSRKDILQKLEGIFQ